MIVHDTPLGRGWSLVGAGLLLALVVAVAGLTNAASPALAGTPREAAEPPPEQIAERIAVLRTTRIGDENQWAAAVRDLVKIGAPAVPPLIEELDRTTEQLPLRALGFTLRALGDARAVPALIRAIPRTLIGASSDFGVTVADAELLAFMQQHDLDKRDVGELFGFGRPFREITGALQAITGQRFNEDELNFVHLAGGPVQRRLQRQLFHQLATRWAGWWEANWRRFTNDPALAKVNLPPLPETPKPTVAAGQPFPTGAKVRTSNAAANAIVGPPQSLEYYRTFQDLDTGRNLKWPDVLGAPEKAKADAVAAWAAREGYDLQGTEYRPAGSDRSAYALRGQGLRAWQIDNGRYSTIEEELRSGKAPELGRPAGDLLMDFDPQTETYHPENEATFLFVTREGTTGVLQVTGLITELFRSSDIGRPSGGKTNRGFYRGVQFQYKLLYEEGNEGREGP